MAEDKKNLPDAPNDAERSSDEVIGKLTDAIEKKLHENEDENVPVEEPPKQTDDDILSEIRGVLDKAETDEEAAEVLTGSTGRLIPDNPPEPVKEDSEEITESEESDDTADQFTPIKPKGNWQSGSIDKKEPKNSNDGTAAKRAKKRNPAKLIIFILAFIIVAVGVFALVHFVIAPNVANGTTPTDAPIATTASDGTAATDDQAPTVAPTETGSALMATNAMKDMTRREKICQLFFVTPETLTDEQTVTQAGPLVKEGLNTYPVGGVIFTQQNLTGEDQAKSLISDTQSYSKIPLFIAVDDDAIISAQQGGGPQSAPQGGPEGGPQQGGPEGGSQGGLQQGGPQQGGPGSQLTVMDTSPEGAYDEAITTAADKRSVGFNLDFSINADMSDAKNADSELTDNDLTELLSAVVAGYSEGGVIPALKYFPGTASDAESGFPHITRSVDEISSGDLPNFKTGIEAGAAMVMVDNVIVDSLDNEKPATLSGKVVPRLLRQKLEYQGVVISGNMSDNTLTTEYSYNTIAKSIFESDVDMILNPNSIGKYVTEIENELDKGTITEEQLDAKVKRILTLKFDRGVMKGSE